MPSANASPRWPKVLFTDGNYDRFKLLDKEAYRDVVLGRRREGVSCFEVLLRRWVVDRIFGWLTREGVSALGL